MTRTPKKKGEGDIKGLHHNRDRQRAAQRLRAIRYNVIAWVTHYTDGVKTPIGCQRRGVSIKVPCRDICPQAHTQCWHPSLTPNPAVSPPAPWVLITAITHLFLSVQQTISSPLQDRGVDRSINWSVIKPGLSDTASQVPTCILGQLWVHEGIIGSLIVITRTWRSRGSLGGVGGGGWPARCWDANDIMLPPKSLLLPGQRVQWPPELWAHANPWG